MFKNNDFFFPSPAREGKACTHLFCVRSDGRMSFLSLSLGRGTGPLPLQWEGVGTQVPVNWLRCPLIFPSQERATGPFFSQGRREEGKSSKRCVHALAPQGGRE